MTARFMVYKVPFASKNKVELAWEMYETSMCGNESENIHDWGIEVCKRIEEQFEIDIAYKNPVQLVDELIRVNLIKEVH